MKNIINKFHCGNSIKFMSKMPSECVDLILTSPPYDNLRDYQGYNFDFEKMANEIFRVIKKGGVIVWVVGDKINKGNRSLTSFKQALYFQSLGLNAHDIMIYAKKIHLLCVLMPTLMLMNTCLFFQKVAQKPLIH
ncbi:MAG: DNA methyltransferase [Campylobacteraceae bacterium]|nr:DNA methyltransferase [Campylobacteraceae bacterium]